MSRPSDLVRRIVWLITLPLWAFVSLPIIGMLCVADGVMWIATGRSTFYVFDSPIACWLAKASDFPLHT